MVTKTVDRLKFFRIQAFCMSVQGGYLEMEKNTRWNRMRNSINCSLSYALLICQSYATSKSMENRRILCHLLGLLVGIFLCCIKIRTLDVQVNDFVELNRLLTDLSTDMVPNDRKKLMRANKLGQTLSLINIISLLMSTVSLIVYPLGLAIYQYIVTDAPATVFWPLPFDSKFPFDASYSPVYELVYIFILHNFIICCFSINATDSMFCEAALLIACHFEILKRDIENLQYDCLKEDLSRIFTYHRRILRAKEALQKAYSVILPFFVIVATTMFGMFVISALKVIYRGSGLSESEVELACI